MLIARGPRLQVQPPGCCNANPWRSRHASWDPRLPRQGETAWPTPGTAAGTNCYAQVALSSVSATAELNPDTVGELGSIADADVVETLPSSNRLIDEVLAKTAVRMQSKSLNIQRPLAWMKWRGPADVRRSLTENNGPTSMADISRLLRKDSLTVVQPRVVVGFESWKSIFV
uniref:Uncharacterized protein n=1 Tax=Trichuris muris TaxID=70415 RepID=A0A5S6Q6K2_TRIMR